MHTPTRGNGPQSLDRLSPGNLATMFTSVARQVFELLQHHITFILILLSLPLRYCGVVSAQGITRGL